MTKQAIQLPTGAYQMHTLLHHTRRFVLIAAGAVALAAGPAAQIASADVRDNSGPVKSNQTRASGDQCKMYNDWYKGDVAAGATKDAAYDKQLASDRGCTWAQALTVSGGLGSVPGSGLAMDPPPSGGSVATYGSGATYVKAP